jgi:hypothetical protein
VHVVTHEAMHMAGHLDESAAECAAVQRDARTARLLGAPGGEARTLAAAHWRTVYPAMPGGYRSSACRPAGALDEHLPDAPGRRPAPEVPRRGGGSIAGPVLLCYKSGP